MLAHVSSTTGLFIGYSALHCDDISLFRYESDSVSRCMRCASLIVARYLKVIGPIPWGHSGKRFPLSRVVVVVVVGVVVDIDAQAARDLSLIHI